MFRRPTDGGVGHAAPPFALPAQDGSTYDLLAQRGKRRVVVAFYPEDDTLACAHAMGEVQKALERFAARRTDVVAISHNTIRSHLRFANKYGLTFPLLSDLTAEVAKPYGAKGLLPFFKRRAAVIDGRGVLRLVRDGMPDVEELLTFIDGLAGDLPPG